MRVLFLFFLLFCFSCNKSTPAKSNILKINLGSDPHTLDPRKARDVATTTLMHMLYEGLTRTSHDNKVELAVAKEVEISEDGLVYIFRLRNTHWSNKDIVTSFDFLESWKSLLDPSFPSDMAYHLYVIKNAKKAKLGEVSLEKVGISAPDCETLVVELESATPYFLELVAMSPFFAIHSKSLSSAKNELITNGPFQLDSWQRSSILKLKKNENYFDQKNVSIDGIDLYMVTGDLEMKMFEDGLLDWAGSPIGNLPVDALEYLKKSNALEISPFSSTYFFRVNTSEKINDKKNPLSSAKFRKALSLCIDRHAIAEHILQGGQKPAMSLVPPEMGLSEHGYFQDFSPERAKAFLFDALLELDLTLEKLEPITLSFKSNQKNSAIAQGIKEQIEENLEIKIELRAVEPKVFLSHLSQKNYQLAASDWVADFNDPINFLEVFKYKSDSTNNTGWENPKYIDLLNLSGLCSDLEERKALLRQAEQILMDQMPIIPIYHSALNYLKNPNLKKVCLSPLGQIDFRWSQLEEKPSFSKR